MINTCSIKIGMIQLNNEDTKAIEGNLLSSVCKASGFVPKVVKGSGFDRIGDLERSTNEDPSCGMRASSR